jgi:hypothetical protein
VEALFTVASPIDALCHTIGPVPEQDFPDRFADAVTVSSSPYGVTLTFYLSDPLSPQGSPGRIVSRVRVGPLLAEALADNIKQGLSSLPDRTGRKADEDDADK